MGNAVAALLRDSGTTPPPDSRARPRAELDGAASARAHARSPAPQKPPCPAPSTTFFAILDLERLEINLFRGNSPQVGWQRVFGGQVIGQALVAACRTVEGRGPHSLHAYFLSAGDPKVPIIYEVDRIRDGRSFTTRRVIAIQHGQPIFAMSVSFHGEEPGFEHAAPMPKVPRPEDLPSEHEMKAGVMPLMPGSGAGLLRARAADRAAAGRVPPLPLARADGARRSTSGSAPPAALPDDPAIHQCVLAYASDMTLLDSSLIAHGRTVFERSIQAASLDHALWFHRPFRADEWLLYAQESPSASGARGFSRGLIFSRDGRLVASVAQEGLIRDPRPRESSRRGLRDGSRGRSGP